MKPVTLTILSISLACLFLAVKADAHPAWGIAVDRQGQVYFSGLLKVWKLDTNGTLSVVRAKDDIHTHDLNVDDAGNLYGADNSYDPATKRFFSALWRLTPGGEFSYLLAPTDDPPEGTSIWRDRAGNAYHAVNFPENKLLVLKRTPAGHVFVLAGDSTALRNYRQGVPYSWGMAFDSSDTLYFVHDANVSKIASDNTIVPLARNVLIERAAGQSGVDSPTQLFGIAVNAQGIVFVADYGNRRVLKITPEGESTTSVRAEEPWYPTGVACLGNDLYILEHSFTPAHAPLHTRVRRLTPDGRINVLATVGESGTAAASLSGDDDPVQSEPKRRGRNLLIATGIVIFVLTSVILWRASTRVFNCK